MSALIVFDPVWVFLRTASTFFDPTMGCLIRTSATLWLTREKMSAEAGVPRTSTADCETRAAPSEGRTSTSRGACETRAAPSEGRTSTSRGACETRANAPMTASSVKGAITQQSPGPAAEAHPCSRWSGSRPWDWPFLLLPHGIGAIGLREADPVEGRLGRLVVIRAADEKSYAANRKRRVVGRVKRGPNEPIGRVLDVYIRA